MEFKDYYRILGVEREATADDIKKAFRKAARRYHPDVSRERDAEARMKEVNEAYAVLSDPEKRAAYDQLGQGWQGGQEFRAPPGWDSGFEFSGASPGGGAADFSDFFAELFGRVAGRGSGMHGRAAHAHGEDHHARIQIDLAEAYRGATRQVTLRVPSLDAQGRMQINTRTLNVQIPQGIAEGQMMRLAGQGAAAHGGGPAGDLLLEVQFRPDSRFRVDGRDVLATLNVAPWEAALGAVVPVQLPDGTELRVRIPEGSQSGRQLRVRGKGIPGPSPGDLLLDVRVVLPPAGSARARELYETMARELAFDPRAEG